MSSSLMVPVHLDALHCPVDRAVVQATADFSKLPFSDGARDFNGDVAHISEEIVAEPFQDETLLLPAGLHLHWSLPDALTRGRHRPLADGVAHRTSFPAAPNRWLVRRSVAPGSPASLAPRAWVVESDYLAPDGAVGGGVAVPFATAPEAGRYRPFRSLGRAVPLDLWQERDPAAEYVVTLTAVGFEMADGSGYSDPAFAAFYPNSRSVFGFYDAEVGAQIPSGLRYDLLGWYGDVTRDFLYNTLAELGGSDETVLEPLAQTVGWTLTPDADKRIPKQMICYARVEFDQPAPAAHAEPTLVTVGNTGTEALSAALAAQIDRERRFQIEDQLEAIQLAARIEHRRIDLDAKLREARHAKGFTGHSGGTLWSIRLVADSAAAPASADRSQKRSSVQLSPELAGLLAALNAAQQNLDQTEHEVESLRRQLFADWYKYMVCVYPPDDTGEGDPNIDVVRAFIAGKSLPELRERAGALGHGPGTVADQRAGAFAAVRQALDALNALRPLKETASRYELKPLVAPRFWQPTDPVVLLRGPDARPSDRHGQDGRLRPDGLLSCFIGQVESARDLLVGDAARASAVIDDLRAQEGAGDSVAFRRTDGRPWHPFLLEWEVELLPMRGQGNIAPEADSYEPDFITHNYALAAHGPDLAAKAPLPDLTAAEAIYTGASFLTYHAGEQLRRRLAEYLRKEVLPAFKASPAGQAAGDDPAPVIDALQTWYEQTNAAGLATPQAKAADQAYSAIRALRELLRMPFLSQALGGFNDALLMHRTVKQLPVDDPLGFADYRAFTREVAKEIGTSNRSAPEPLNDFNPIRSGAMRLRRLRLIDTFGQAREVAAQQALAAEPMTIAGRPELIGLPPRLSQPARLQFRWLDEDREHTETNDHPDTTPVCGWLLPNHLDTSLMIYDRRGRALGMIDSRAVWRPAPGGGAASAGAIRNPHLQRTVDDIVGQGPTFLAALMEALDAALERIEPETTDQHIDMAVLVGRPIALVRAQIDLDVLGLPAVHQGWNQFRQDLWRTTRDSDGFTAVRFPVRLGAPGQLDDGLIGYWDDGDPDAAGVFFSPQEARYDHPSIRTDAGAPLQILHALDDPPHIVRMLLDPRGNVHATSGIQPAKAIGIPPTHYAAALGAIEVTFQSTPVLTEAGAINLPLPSEPGYRWSWLAAEHGAWDEVTSSPSIDRAAFCAALAERVWEQLADPHIGWLRPLPGASDSLRAVGADERASARLDAPFAPLTARIEPILSPLGTHIVGRQAVLARLANEVAATAWDALAAPAAGWLRPTGGDAGRALITPKDSRPARALAGELAGAEALFDAIFDLSGERLGPASTAANFAAPQVARGGWLKLRPDDTQHS